MTPEGLWDLAERIGGAGLFLGATVAGVWNYRRRSKPKAGVAEEAAVVAAAFASPNTERLMLEHLKRLGDIGDVGNQALDRLEDSTNRVERAVRDLCAANERNSARQEDALNRLGERKERER